MQQHVLPKKAYLKGFHSDNCTQGLNPCLWVYYIKDKIWKRESPKSLTCQENIFSFIDGTGEINHYIEKKLKNTEDEALHIFEKKIFRKKLLKLIEKEKLSIFFVLILIRCILVRGPDEKGLREFFEKYKNTHDTKLTQETYEASRQYLQAHPDINQIKKLKVYFNSQYINEHASILLNMSWDIVWHDELNFITSDSPLTGLNFVSTGRNTNDLRNINVKIFFPLSSKMLLYMHWTKQSYFQIYKKATEEQIKDSNIRTSLKANEFLISNKNSYIGFDEFCNLTSKLK